MPDANEKAAQIKAAKDALAKAKTKEEVVAVWNAHYGTVGHRALGRMLVGTYDEWAKKQGAKAA